MSTATKFVHLAWQREEKLLADARYPMAADPTGSISRLFGVYDEQTGLPFRGTFIISPEGKLVSAEIHFYNVGRNIDELLRKVKANRYLADHPHEACPAQWKDAGDRTLIPSAQLVGRVAEAMR